MQMLLTFWRGSPSTIPDVYKKNFFSLRIWFSTKVGFLDRPLLQDTKIAISYTAVYFLLAQTLTGIYISRTFTSNHFVNWYANFRLIP